MSKEISLHQAALSSPAVAVNFDTNQATAAAALSAPEQQALPPGSQPTALPAPSQTYDDSLDAIRGLVKRDPKLAAQVVKNWVGDD